MVAVVSIYIHIRTGVFDPLEKKIYIYGWNEKELLLSLKYTSKGKP